MANAILKSLVAVALSFGITFEAIAQTAQTLPASRPSMVPLGIILFGAIIGAVLTFLWLHFPKEPGTPVRLTPEQVIVLRAAVAVLAAVIFVALVLWHQTGRMPTEVLAAIVGAVITSVFSGIGLLYQRKQVRLQEEQIRLERVRLEESKRDLEATSRKLAEYEQLFDDAPKRFTAELGRLIEGAASERTAIGTLTSAKALVSARDGLRSSLEAMGGRLNSDITRLADEVTKDHPNIDTVKELILIIRKKWPTKALEIEHATRKVQTDLGLVPTRRPIR